MLSHCSHVRLFATSWKQRSPGSSVSGNFPSKNTGVGFHFLLQGIFLTQGSKLCLLHWRWILYCWATWEAPKHIVVIFLLVWGIFNLWSGNWDPASFMAKKKSFYRSGPWGRTSGAGGNMVNRIYHVWQGKGLKRTCVLSSFFPSFPSLPSPFLFFLFPYFFFSFLPFFFCPNSVLSI